jgi:hypothetical protein
MLHRLPRSRVCANVVSFGPAPWEGVFRRFRVMFRAVALALTCAVGLPGVSWAVDKDKAEYVGGTLAAMAPKTEGVLATSDTTKLIFVGEKSGGIVEIPYKKVLDIEYGQKVGRRWKSALLLGPAMLFSKGRKHYVTITFKGQSGDEAAIFELGKEIVRPTLTILEARTGRKVTYQDEEAAKARGN